MAEARREDDGRVTLTLDVEAVRAVHSALWHGMDTLRSMGRRDEADVARDVYDALTAALKQPEPAAEPAQEEPETVWLPFAPRKAQSYMCRDCGYSTPVVERPPAHCPRCEATREKRRKRLAEGAMDPAALAACSGFGHVAEDADAMPPGWEPVQWRKGDMVVYVVETYGVVKTEAARILTERSPISVPADATPAEAARIADEWAERQGDDA